MSDDDAPQFLPLFVNLQLNSVIQQDKMGDFMVPPYDLHCPSVEPFLRKRCCSVCGIYHASLKALVIHMKDCHPKSPPPIAVTPVGDERIRPVRIAARRQRELMVILRDHLNGEAAKWLDDVDIGTGQQERDSPAQSRDAVPIIGNIQMWAENPWEDV